MIKVAKKAIAEFRSEHGITEPMQMTSHPVKPFRAVFWRKEKHVEVNYTNQVHRMERDALVGVNRSTEVVANLVVFLGLRFARVSCPRLRSGIENCLACRALPCLDISNGGPLPALQLR